MKIKLNELYKNNLLLGLEKSNVDVRYKKLCDYELDKTFTFYKPILFIKLLNRILKSFAQYKGDFLVYISNEYLKDEFEEEFTKRNMQYFFGKWSRGIFSNPSVLREQENILRHNERIKKVTFNKKSLKSISDKIDRIKSVYGGIKNIKNVKKIFCIGKIDQGIINECLQSGVKVFTTVNNKTFFRGVEFILCNTESIFANRKMIKYFLKYYDSIKNKHA